MGSVRNGNADAPRPCKANINAGAKQELKEVFADDERVALSKIENKDGIYQSIREFLGRGR